jgi:hypothetical protein
MWGLTACSDFLDQTSPSEMTSTAVFNSVTYTQEALNKVYADLVLDHTYGCRIPLNFAMNTDIELVDYLGSDPASNINERGLCNYYASPGWNRMDSNWETLYAIIENANEVIEGVDASPLLSTSKSTAMLRLKGEALAIRAMVYFDLVRLYGDVPMKFESTKNDGSNIYVGKTDRDSIYDHIIADLEYAKTVLPWAGQNGYTTEKATKGFAYGLIARIALAQAGYSIREAAKSGYETLPVYSDATYPTQRPDASKREALYKKAFNNLDTLIASGYHKLNPSFDNEWDLINKRTLDTQYQENLYEVAHGLNYSGEMGYTSGVRLNGVTTTYGYGNSSGKVKLTANFMYSFNSGDTRRNITFAPFEIKPIVAGGSAIEIMGGNTPFGIYVGKWDPRRMDSEWLANNKAANGKVGYGINWVVMRFSDVLLMYSEVANELYGPASAAGSTCGLTAKEALMEVHSRAYSKANKSVADAYGAALPTDKEGFFDAIVNERAWELAGEAVRKYDLIRWGLLSKKIDEAKQDYLTKLANGVFPKKLYYKMMASDSLRVDSASICWTPEQEAVAATNSSYTWVNATNSNCKSPLDFFGAEDLTKGKNVGYLPYISAGLNDPVKYRYILPIGTTTIANSNGYLKNSYGY